MCNDQQYERLVEAMGSENPDVFLDELALVHHELLGDINE